MNADVIEATPNRSGEAVPSLCLTMDALNAPAMALIQPVFTLAPMESLAPRPEQRSMVEIEDDHAGMARSADASGSQRTAATISGTGLKMLEGAALELALRAQYFPSWTAYDVVVRVKLEPPRRDDLAWRLFRLGGHDAFDLAILQSSEDLGVGITRIHRRDGDRLPGLRDDRIKPSGDRHALIFLTGRDLDIDDHTGDIIDGGMLLVGRFETTVAAVGCHRGIGVGYTHLL